jgi:hypothetical protein
MAKQVLKNCYVEINSVDRSTNTSKVSVEWEGDEVEFTTYGSGGAREYLGGLETSKMSFTFKQDVAAAALDSAIWALRNTLVTVKVRANSSAISTSNPSYEGSVLISKWNPISGKVGDGAETDVTWKVSGLLSRATA